MSIEQRYSPVDPKEIPDIKAGMKKYFESQEFEELGDVIFHFNNATVSYHAASIEKSDQLINILKSIN